MFEQIIKGVLWFAVATYAIGTFKTLVLASAAEGRQGAGLVLVKEESRKPLIHPVIDGTDMPMPFATPIQTASRVVGLSRLYYAVHVQTAVWDSRFPSFWK